MKRMTFVLAFTMLVLFSQCKKQENSSTDTPVNGIQMVLKADNGSSKTTFGANGSITWNTNERIYVVTNGQCVGSVTNGAGGGNTFTGTLNGITVDGTYDFHYYYVGNTQTIANDATSFTMDFSDQDGTLANLGDFHVGYGEQSGVAVTTGETVTAQASMKSLVSMAYFNTSGMAETGEKVYFYGEHVNNQMTINFSTNAPSFGKVNDGWICAGTASSGSYVMLLPNHADGTEVLDTDITFVSKRTTGTCNDVFQYGIVGGRFYCDGGNTDSPIAVTATAYDEGTLRGLFTIASGKQAHFSQGNLQYTKSTEVWSFMENQYDIVETHGQDVGTDYANQDVVSHFGWGTSGCNLRGTATNYYYQPYNTYYNNGYSYVYYGGVYYGPELDANNLTGDFANGDWGVYNAISNGGNVSNHWRTPSKNEWVYIISERDDASSKWGHGSIGGVNGVILVPDEWELPEGLSFTSGNSNWANAYTIEQWEHMEIAGAVFLPAAGSRLGTTISTTYAVGKNGYYWSSSYADGYMFQGFHVTINPGEFSPQNHSARSEGLSVRLVRDVD